jgi:glycerol kinase
MSATTAILALDQGTSVTRAALFRDGRVVAQARRANALHFPSPGRAEQDPKELLDAASDVIAETCSALRPGERAALGIANQRSTVVLWDSETGRALGPALSWRDVRASDESDALAARVKDLQARTGLPAMPHYGAPKIAWALKHWPDAKSAARRGTLRVGPVSTWLCWKLSNGECFAIDPTNAQRMLLLGLGSLQWDDDLVQAAGLPLSALPQVRPTDGAFGSARCGAHALPVVAMLGDQQAALAGTGDLGAERALVQLGTGGFVLKATGSQPIAAPGLLTGIARADANRARAYLLEGPVNSAGSALDRLRDLGILRDGDDLGAMVDASSSPAVVVPAWAGLASPWWAPSARAALMGWDESTTRADIVAGTIRGIAFLVADILDFMTAAGVRVTGLALAGSLSTIPAVAQAIADATRLPSHVRENPEATLEGIATVLAEATGAQPPVLSLESASPLEPRRDVSASRAAFGHARLAAARLPRRPAGA